jgi:uncharacterized Zn finger protein/DNA-binding XRE family transcriptional regulator
MSKRHKQGLTVQPVEIEGRKIARTFWGEAWCNHLESFSDYANRLPRGRTYVRNGSVCHLEISGGEIKAVVSGSSLYDVKISIRELPREKWNIVTGRCSGKIGSLLELLQGKLSNGVMAIVTDRDEGLFPLPGDIQMHCSCPDWAVMCKHVAAVLYGVGARLDRSPEFLFVLRGVDHGELITANAAAATSITKGRSTDGKQIAESDLEDLFGIEMVAQSVAPEKQDHNQRRKEAAARMPDAPPSVEPAPKRKNEKLPATPPEARTAGKKEQASEMPRSTRNSRKEEKSALAASPGKEQPVTGKFVRELRANLDLTQSELARLIGVSTTSVSNWENGGRGRLNLQPRTQSALTAAAKLTKRQARSRLGL